MFLLGTGRVFNYQVHRSLTLFYLERLSLLYIIIVFYNSKAKLFNKIIQRQAPVIRCGGGGEGGGAGTFSGVGFFCDVLGGGSEINNPWSRGSNIFLGKCVGGWGGGAEFSFHKKCLSFWPPRPPISHTFSVSILFGV